MFKTFDKIVEKVTICTTAATIVSIACEILIQLIFGEPTRGLVDDLSLVCVLAAFFGLLSSFALCMLLLISAVARSLIEAARRPTRSPQGTRSA